jgi:FAD/FMN-containing dehydrogenase
MCLFPSELGILIEEAEELRRFAATFPESPPVGLSAHVGAGILRVAVRGLPEDAAALALWVGSLRKLRARLEERGGTLTLSVGPAGVMNEVGAWGSAGGAQRLMEGLKAEFDPKGILAPGRLGL